MRKMKLNVDNRKILTYKDLCKYRPVWMGFAMLWIVFFHAPVKANLPFLENIQSVGYGGVDLFIFASGIGCYISLARNDRVSTFYRNRFIKILPMYYTFLVIWILFIVLIKHESVTFVELLGNIVMIGGVLGLSHQFNWYTAAMVVTYTIAPICYAFLNNSSKKLLVFCTSLFVSFVVLWSILGLPVLIVITRLPTFLIGMIIGKQAKLTTSVKKSHIYLMSALLILGIVMLMFSQYFMSDYLSLMGLYWLPFILIAPNICMLFSIAIIKYNKSDDNIFIRMLNILGKHTFSVYLIHILLFEALKFYDQSHYITNMSTALVISLIALVPLCIGLEKVNDIYLGITCGPLDKFFRSKKT